MSRDVHCSDLLLTGVQLNVLCTLRPSFRGPPPANSRVWQGVSALGGRTWGLPSGLVQTFWTCAALQNSSLSNPSSFLLSFHRCQTHSMVEGCPISICSYSFPQDTFCMWNLVLASAMWQTQTEESACFCEHYFLGDVSSSFAHEASPHPYIKMPTSAEQTLFLPFLLRPSQWEAPLSSQFCQHRLVAHLSGVLQRRL